MDEKYNLAINLCNKFNLQFIGFKVIKTKTNIEFICNIHKDKGVQCKDFYNFKHSKYGCPFCYGLHQTTEDLKKHPNLNKNVEILGEYVLNNIKVECRCRQCEHIWYVTPNHLKHGRGCPKCQIIDSTNKRRKTHSEFLIEVSQNNPNIEIINEYTGIDNKIKCRCKIHKCEWESPAYNIATGKKGCPICNASTGENIITSILYKYNIKFTRQYSYKDCRHKSKLFFDFYLDDFNILIEYQGRQHYMPINFGSKENDKSKENFISGQIRDNIKKEYCKKNNIPLIIIPYWEKENLTNYLLNCLKDYNILL